MPGETVNEKSRWTGFFFLEHVSDAAGEHLVALGGCVRRSNASVEPVRGPSQGLRRRSGEGDAAHETGAGDVFGGGLCRCAQVVAGELPFTRNPLPVGPGRFRLVGSSVEGGSPTGPAKGSP